MFVHTKSRSLLLEADPAVIAAAVPAIELPGGQGYNVAVKHTAATTLKLREMGYDAPSPMMAYYNWPKYKGKFEPFAHQKLMAEFLSMHKRCFNLGEMGCFDASTEYLSPTGWQRFDSYKGGKVAQYHPETGQIEFVKPTKYVKLPCATMIRLKTTRGVDQLLSPEHRVLLADGRVVSADDVMDAYGTQSLEARSHRFRTTFKFDGPGLALMSDDEIRLQVAVNADGHMPKRSLKAYVRLKKPRKIERMKALLSKVWPARATPTPCQPAGFVKFSFRPPLSKGFGPEWYSCTAAQLAIVVDEAVHWDGSVGIGSRGFRFTGTKADVDFMQFACAATGRRSTIHQDKRSSDLWDLTVDGGEDTTVGLIQRGSKREPNVRYEPSPDGFKYCFMVPSTFLMVRRNGCIVASGNTGKTNSVLWALDYMMREGLVTRALILSPLSTLERTWLIGAMETVMHRKVVVVYGSREKRLKLLAEKADIYVINHDGISIKSIREALKLRRDIDQIVVDEGGDFRNAKTDKYRCLEQIVAPPWRGLWWLTGTPCPKGPDNAWAQVRLVNPAAVPRFFGSFRAQVMMEVNEHIWKPKAGHQDIVFKAMQPAIRFAKNECLDLPPMVTEDWACTMSAEQQRAFTQMANAMAVADKALADAGQSITAVNAADRINKLRQIMVGSVKTGQGAYVTYDYSPRFKVLLEAIEQASAKVIVIAPFKGIIQDLQGRLARHHSVAMVNGDVSYSKRNKIFADFKDNADPHVLLCHPEVMSHGLNLTEADTLVMFGPIYSNDVYRQVIERINRPPQDKKMTTIRIGCNAIEWAIYKALDTDEAQQRLILNLYRSVVHGPR